MQYYQVRKQAEKVIALKQEYKGYIFAVKKAVQAYQKAKELEQQVVESKKKMINDAEDQFIRVNREPRHLQQSSLNFIKKNGHDAVLRRMSADALVDYHEQLERKHRIGKNSVKKTYALRKQVARKKAIVPMRSKHVSTIADISLQWPIERSKFWLSSFFGPRKNPNGSWGFHHGIDMAAIKGTPVYAACSGVVTQAGRVKGFGKTVEIAHTVKYKTRYAHLSEIVVHHGQKVQQGQLIGRVGDTGFVRSVHGKDPSHLHFEVLVFGKRRNPMYFFM